jgi:hypothetical protein
MHIHTYLNMYIYISETCQFQGIRQKGVRPTMWCVQLYLHIHAYAYTCTHVHVHTHIHVYTYIRSLPTSRNQAKRSTTDDAMCTATASCFGRYTMAGVYAYIIHVHFCVDKVDRWCDVYSCGILLWEIYHGRCVYVCMHNTFACMCRRSKPVMWCVHLCIYLCMYVCMYVCVCVCTMWDFLSHSTDSHPLTSMYTATASCFG